MRKQLGRFLGLIIVTGLGLAVAILVTAGGGGRAAPEKSKTQEKEPPPAPVSTMEAQLEWIEITDSYSGMIRPLERFSLGFEIAGRVSELGKNESGKPLDEGDHVTKDQVVARLDDEVLQSRLVEAKAQIEEANARLEEAKARLKKAAQDMKRSDRLKRLGSGAITDAEYQDDAAKLEVAQRQAEVAQAQVAMAAAMSQTAQKNLEDTTLKAPESGVISKRMANVGESVNPQQPVMEIIQVEEDSPQVAVLLVVGVPEAYVGEIRKGQKAHVELLARDRFRQKRPTVDGEVYRVAEAADQTTGLFEVEIELPNPEGIWRPGLIALAHIVIDRIEGFRVPMACAAFRDDETFLFTVVDGGKAHRFNLCEKDEKGNVCQQWIEQGPDLIIPRDWVEQCRDPLVSGLALQGLKVIRRGQHRLTEGREVRMVELPGEKPGEEGSGLRVRGSALSRRSPPASPEPRTPNREP